MAPIPDLTADTALSPKQIEVIFAVAGGQSLTSAAETAGVHRSTVALALRAPFIVVLVLAGAGGAVAHVLTG